jgi:serine/threonine-protein kinase HipA
MHGQVYNNGILAGILQRENENYIFEYDQDYLSDPANPSICTSLSKSQRTHHSKTLFPFFYGLLAEGVDKELQCRTLRIDENDHFNRLLKTAGSDTIGAITVRGVE